LPTQKQQQQQNGKKQSQTGIPTLRNYVNVEKTRNVFKIKQKFEIFLNIPNEFFVKMWQQDSKNNC
jgi:hypothetical protein